MALFRPKLIVAGASAYPRLYDYELIHKVCDKQKAVLLADMARISRLVTAGVIPSPFDYADVVRTTSNKSPCGPCCAMIFLMKGVEEVNKQGKEVLYDFEKKFSAAVFPGLQAGPCNHTIAGLAVTLKQAPLQNIKHISYEFLEIAQNMVRAVEKGYEQLELLK